MPDVLLIQLPLHPSTAWEPTGNIVLAPAALAAAAGLPHESVCPQKLLDSLGDFRLAEEINDTNPSIIAATMYLWNRERTLYLLRKLKELNPELLVVVGGPEVTPDNHTLMQEPVVDLFVVGEGEPYAKATLDPENLRKIVAEGIRFLGPKTATFRPDYWPDPYSAGYLSPAFGGSVHIETQRGCSNNCSYCAYRKTSSMPRMVPAGTVLDKLQMFHNMGAEEVVFLDPTFNMRPDLKKLLRGMSRLDFNCFAEVRGDLLRFSETTDLLAKAGFTSLEVGLQTMNSDVLAAVGRGGNPTKVLNGAGLLKESGVTPIIDLILGLPGDQPENIVAAANTIVAKQLGDQVQTFCLSVLPGTDLKKNAQSLGIEYTNTPPYTVSRTGSYTITDFLHARERISDVLGYDADPAPRPVFCDTFPGMQVFTPEQTVNTPVPSARHGVLRVITADAWQYRHSVIRQVRLRKSRDPYCPLDVIIQSNRIFPLDLIEMLLKQEETACYTTEKSRIYGLPGLLRPAVIAPPSADSGWLFESSQLAPTVVKSRSPVSLPGGDVGLLLCGNHDLSQLSALYSSAPHLVFFEKEELERLWNLEVLELG